MSNVAIYDSDIRQVLIENLINISEFNNDDTFLINELDICGGANRADIVIVNGKLHGYEIKSPQDNLERLASQVSSYNEVFDTMTLVTCEKYFNQVKSIVPNWWGISCVDNTKKGLTLKIKRRPKINKNINSLQLAKLLWKDELLELLYSRTQITGGLKSKSRHQLALLVSNRLSQDDINEYVRSVLKNREGWKAVPLTKLCDDLHKMKPIA